MANPDYDYHKSLIVNLEDNSIFAHANAPCVCATAHLYATGWSRIHGQRINATLNPIAN
jgi:hypothetical protein